jgi:hypothetical protein
MPTIKNFCQQLANEVESIPIERKQTLKLLSDYIQLQKDQAKTIQLLFVCTHNSRRSHFGQIWATVAANFFNIENVKTFSGGTQATCFNENAIAALQTIGFEINAQTQIENPHYQVQFGEQLSVECFSKCYDDPSNPKETFAAIMTCSDADQNCPVIFGADKRISLRYDDPKTFDGTAQQHEKYLERSAQIAKEMLFAFSQIK